MTLSSSQIYISTSAVSTKSSIDAILQLLPITSSIELSGGCSHDPQLLSKLIDLKQKYGVNLLLHSYFPPPEENFVLNFADTSDKTRSFIKKSMEYVKALKIPYYSIHAGFRKDFAADSYGILHQVSDKKFRLSDIAENVDWFQNHYPATPLLLENIYPNGGDTSCAFMMSYEEICEAMDTIPEIDLLLDLGHLKVSANLMHFNLPEAADNILKRYCNRIKELHLSENLGIKDDHLQITEDSWQKSFVYQWSKIIVENCINLTLETRAASFKETETSFNNILNSLQFCTEESNI